MIDVVIDGGLDEIPGVFHVRTVHSNEEFLVFSAARRHFPSELDGG